MKVIKLKIEALQPLVITDGTTEGQTHKTLEYIPGNMILGSLATAWKRNNPNVIPDDSGEFCNLFLSSKVKWGHAFPLAEDEQTVPVPLCYQKIKNYGGLPTVGSKNAAKSRVLNLSEISLDSEQKLINIIKNKMEWGLDENAVIKLKQIEQGFMTAKDKCQPDIHTIWNMHVAIGKNRTAANGQLFGYSALEKGTKFISEIYCDDNCEQSLKDLLNSVNSLYIGHSRSAGYGKISTCVLSCNNLDSQSVLSNSAKLFLLSGYISNRSWELPLNNLEKELQKYFVNAKLSKLYCLYDTLNGFNSLWSLPRKARQMLIQGSVIEITFDSVRAEFPEAIGGYTNEGYGRILLNPEFLNSPFVDTADIEKQKIKEKFSSNLVSSSVYNLLKTRAIYRIARDSALRFVARTDIAIFIDSQKKTSDISASQRGNLRNMIFNLPKEEWLPKFKSILEKTPGEQWKNSEGRSPFHDGKFFDMSVIMSDFLNPDTFMKTFDVLNENKKILGQVLTKEDKDLYFNEYYRHALLNMLKEWDMKAKRG